MTKKKDFVPGWAKKVVWYQIFPERFRKGNEENNPTRESLKGAWPHDITAPWQLHSWTSDWYELQPYEKKNGKDFWYNIHRRRYGGDLQGIIDKLDYLQELGISAIYLNPVFAAPSSHKYDAYCYHHIDPYFGPDPAGDIKNMSMEIFDKPSTWKWNAADKQMIYLIRDVHKRGMKIIFDGVFNHIGINNIAFTDVLKNKKKSKYKNWFKILDWNETGDSKPFSYKGWSGFNELAEWNQNKFGIVKRPKKYIFDITRRWMDPDNDGNPADGIDGWRLDVAYCIKHPFWKDWRAYVKSINPQAYLTAEVIDSPENLKPYLNGDEFDAVMNYNFAFACIEYFVCSKNKITATEFDRKLRLLKNALPEGVAYVQQNLFDSHDSNRIASHILNRDIGEYRNWSNYFFVSKAENPEYNTGKPGKIQLQIQKLMVIFQMTYVGAPMIYYGDEAGMWGANDPDCRKPMLWDDLKYGEEKLLHDQSFKPKFDKVEVNKELFYHYKKLIKIRNDYPALQIGSFKTILTDDKKDIYVFTRKRNNQFIIVALNNGPGNRRITIELKNSGVFKDVLNGKIFKCRYNKLIFTIPAKWGRILVKQK